MIPKNYSYRPLPFYLTIRKSDIEGLGLFTLEKIRRGFNIGTSHIKYQDELIRTPLGGFINDSDEPNCTLIEYFDGIYQLHSIRDILEKEELTLDYSKHICKM